MGEKSADSDFDARHVMEVNIAVAQLDDDLDIDLNNNSQAEKPQMTTKTVRENMYKVGNLSLKSMLKSQNQLI